MKMIDFFNPNCNHEFELKDVFLEETGKKTLIYGVEFDLINSVDVYKCKKCNVVKHKINGVEEER